MKNFRIKVALIGILLPYLARIPGCFIFGLEWLTSYIGSPALGAFLLIQVFNTICWGSIILVSLLFKRVKYAAIPATTGFLILALLHATLNLASDAQAAIGLVFIPFATLPFIGVASIVAVVLQKRDNTI